MPDTFLQLFHPHCFLLYISVLVSPSLCRVLPRYLNLVTCVSWADCILTLTSGVPFRHMYSVFSLDTFLPLFFKASLHCSSSNSITSFSLAHSTTSSANIICQGASFLMFSGVFRYIFDYDIVSRTRSQSWFNGYLCRLMFEYMLYLLTRLSHLACGPNCYESRFLQLLSEDGVSE